MADTHHTVSTHRHTVQKETSSQLQHIKAPLPNSITKSEMDSQEGQRDALSVPRMIQELVCLPGIARQSQ